MEPNQFESENERHENAGRLLAFFEHGEQNSTKTKIIYFVGVVSALSIIFFSFASLPPFSFPSDKVITIASGTSLSEVSEILNNKTLMERIRRSEDDIKKGRFTRISSKEQLDDFFRR